MPNHYPEHLLSTKSEDAQDSDLAHFLEDRIKVKKFLVLSHLYQRLRYNCTWSKGHLERNSNISFKRQKLWCLSISKFSQQIEGKINKSARNIAMTTTEWLQRSIFSLVVGKARASFCILSLFELLHNLPKGHLISKGLCDSTKKPIYFLRIFALASKKRSDQKNKLGAI